MLLGVDDLTFNKQQPMFQQVCIHGGLTAMLWNGCLPCLFADRACRDALHHTYTTLTNPGSAPQGSDRPADFLRGQSLVRL
jgi:hypothetical protein